MSLIQTQLSIVHLDSGINLSSALQKETRSPAFSFDGVTVTTAAVDLAYGSITSPRTITLKLTSGDDLLISLDNGASYPLSLHGNDDAMLLSLESRETTTITCGSDSGKSLDGKYFDLQDTEGTVRAWFKYKESVSRAKIRVGNNGGTFGTGPNPRPANGSYIQIGEKIYRFVTAVPTVEGDVRINTSSTASEIALNLIRAINHTGVPDVDYKAASAHPTVTAAPSLLGENSEFKTVQIVSKVASSASNSIGLSSTGVINVKFGTDSTVVLIRSTNPEDGSTISLGQAYTFKDITSTINDVKREATVEATTLNLIKAINGTGTAGTHYHAGTVASPYLSCGTEFEDNKLLLTLGSGGAAVSQVTASTTGVTGFLFSDLAGSSPTITRATAGGVDDITTMYGGYSETPPTAPAVGRLLPITLNKSQFVSVTPASKVATETAAGVNQDPEFSALPSGANFTVSNSSVGGFIDAVSGTTGWTIASSSSTVPTIKLKSLGTSEVVVAVIPN